MRISPRIALLAIGLSLSLASCSGDIGKGLQPPAPPPTPPAAPVSPVLNVGFDLGITLVDPVMGLPIRTKDSTVIEASVSGLGTVLLHAFTTEADTDDADGAGTALDPSAPLDTNSGDDVFVAAMTPAGEILDIALVSRNATSAGDGASSKPVLAYRENTGFDPNDPSTTNPAGTIYIAFESDATDLVSGDANAARDIYYTNIQIRMGEDPATATVSQGALNLQIDATCTEAVTSHWEYTASVVPPCGSRSAATGDAASMTPRIALVDDPNSTRPMAVIVFESLATDLVANDTNGASDILRREIIPDIGATSQTTHLMRSNNCISCHVWNADPMSRLSFAQASPGSAANGGSYNPTLVANSPEVVAFESDATDLVTSDSNASRDVFYTIVTNGTAAALTRVGQPSGTESDGDSRNASVYAIDASAGDVLVAFESDAQNLATVTASTNVFIHDSRTNSSTLLSKSASFGSSTLGNAASRSPRFDPTGSTITFLTEANNIANGGSDQNGAADVMRADLTHLFASGHLLLERVSLSTDGEDTDGASTPLSSGMIESRASTGTNGHPLAFDEALLAKARNQRCVNCHGFNAASSTRSVDHPPASSNCSAVACHSQADSGVAAWLAPPAALDFRGKTDDEIFQIFRDASPPSPENHLFNDPKIHWALTDGRTPNGPVQTVPGGRQQFDEQVADWVEGGYLSSDPTAAGGEFVSFLTDATNAGASDVSSLIVGLVNAPADVERASRTDGTDDDDSQLTGASGTPSMTRDDRYIAFETAAAIDAGDTNSSFDVYVRDLYLGRTILVSRSSVTGAANGASRNPHAIVGDNGALFVAFESTATDLVAGFADNNAAAADVYLASFDNYDGSDLSTIDVALISGAGNSPTSGGNGASTAIQIGATTTVSAVFQSTATDLVTGFDDRNGTEPDVFSKTGSNATLLVSDSTTGTAIGGNRASTRPTISGDGQVIVFESLASDLVVGGFTDNNGAAAEDLFLAQAGAGSTIVTGAVIQPGQQTVTLNPTKDNTIWSNSGTASNGLGFIWAGTNNNNSRLRRGLVAFDIQGNLPSGASVLSAELRITEGAAPLGGAVAVALHEALADWGEGTSQGAGPYLGGGSGGSATTGDATWTHSFFNTIMWMSAGGDFDSSSSASASAMASQFTWNGAGLVTDVQGWVDSPTSNFGWFLVSDETIGSSSVFLNSRESMSPPELEITYLPQALPPGSGDGASTRPHLNYDGSILVFESLATTLVTGFQDLNGATEPDILVHDFGASSFSLVSESTAGGAMGGDAASSRPNVSSDGTLVLFLSEATDLVGADTNTATDAFIRNLTDDSTTRRSLGLEQAEGDGPATAGSIGSGTLAVFASDATNMLGADGDTNSATDVFLSRR